MPKGYWPAKNNWTLDQLVTLEEMYALGHSVEDIAKHLGRTATAVTIARKRNKIPSRRRRRLSARGIADLLGIPCSKVVARWADNGWLQARRPGLDRVILRRDLIAFLKDPRYWPAWRPERIRHGKLRAWAEELRRDRLLRIGEVAERFCVLHTSVNKWIHKGLLPAQKYGNWWVRESDLVNFVPPCQRSRKGRPTRRFSRAERRAVGRLRSEGLTFAAIAEALGRNTASVHGAWRRYYVVQSGAGTAPQA